MPETLSRNKKMIVNCKFEKTLIDKDNQSKEFLKKELQRIRNKIEKLLKIKGNSNDEL